MNWILYMIVLLTALYCSICLIYYFVQEKLLFVAKPLRKDFKYDLGRPYIEHFTASISDGEINSILIESEEKKGVVLYCHGNTGNLKRWAILAEEFTTYGFDILVYDYRGYGKSKGKRSEDSFLVDVLKIYELATTYYSPDRIVIYGRSMGTGIAAYLASKVSAAALILETPYYSMIEAAQHHVPFLPVKFLIRFTFKTHQWITNVSSPIHIFHGTKDLIIPYKHGLRLYKLINHNDKNKMVTVPRGKHSNLNSYPLYRDKMKDILGAVASDSKD